MKLNEHEKEELLKTFFAEKIVPLAEKYRSAGKEFFPAGEDERAESYYIDRNDGGNYIHEIDYENLEGELSDMWKGEMEELRELAAPLIELSQKLQEREETEGDVSPFIYAMF